MMHWYRQTWEEAIIPCFSVISPHLPGGTAGGNHENLIWSPHWDWSWGTPWMEVKCCATDPEFLGK